MMNVLRSLLKQLLDNIDSGNSYITELELEEAVDLIQRLTSPIFTKVESYHYLNVSRATFDNYVSKGLLPEGKLRSGWKEKGWLKYDLDKFLKVKNLNKSIS